MALSADEMAAPTRVPSGAGAPFQTYRPSRRARADRLTARRPIYDDIDRRRGHPLFNCGAYVVLHAIRSAARGHQVPDLYCRRRSVVSISVVRR